MCIEITQETTKSAIIDLSCEVTPFVNLHYSTFYGRLKIDDTVIPREDIPFFLKALTAFIGELNIDEDK